MIYLSTRGGHCRPRVAGYTLYGLTALPKVVTTPPNHERVASAICVTSIQIFSFPYQFCSVRWLGLATRSWRGSICPSYLANIFPNREARLTACGVAFLRNSENTPRLTQVPICFP